MRWWAGAVILAAVATGCGPTSRVRPEVVYVDLAALSVAPPTSSQGQISLANVRPLPPAVATLPGRASRNVYAARAGAQVRAAEAELGRLKQADRSRLVTQVQNAYLKRAELLATSENGRFQNERALLHDAAMAELRAEFQRHTDVRGPILDEIVATGGFPTATRASQRFRRTRQFLFPKLQATLDELTAQMLAEDGKYLANREQILADERLATEEAEGAMRARMDVHREDAKKKAKEQVNRLLLEVAATPLSSSKLLEVSATVPTASPQTMRLEALPMAFPRVAPAIQISDSSRQKVKWLVDLWAKRNGVILSDKKSGARDATLEVKRWMNKFRAGR